LSHASKELFDTAVATTDVKLFMLPGDDVTLSSSWRDIATLDVPSTGATPWTYGTPMEKGTHKPLGKFNEKDKKKKKLELVAHFLRRIKVSATSAYTSEFLKRYTIPAEAGVEEIIKKPPLQALVDNDYYLMPIPSMFRDPELFEMFINVEQGCAAIHEREIATGELTHYCELDIYRAYHDTDADGLDAVEAFKKLEQDYPVNNVYDVDAESDPLTDHPHQIAPKEIYHNKGTYYMRMKDNPHFMSLSYGRAVDQLLIDNHDGTSRGGFPSVVAQILAHADRNGNANGKEIKTIDALAGQPAGLLGCNILVRNAYALPFEEPTTATCPDTLALLKQLFGHKQLDLFILWLQRARIALRTCEYSQRHALVLAGAPGAGKTLVGSTMIPALLGSAGDANSYIKGITQFTDSLHSAEVLVIDDKSNGKTGHDRALFADGIKDEVASTHIKRHEAKGVGAFVAPVIRSLVILMNDDESSLRGFPLLGEGDSDSIADKLHMLLVEKTELPTGSFIDTNAYIADMMTREMHAFASYIDTYTSETACNKRFGTEAYHHPELLRKLNVQSPERVIREFVNETFFTNSLPCVGGIQQAITTAKSWTGTAKEFGAMLKQHLSDYPGQSVRKMISGRIEFGDLALLSSKILRSIEQLDDNEGSYTQRKTNGRLVWTITEQLDTADDVQPEQPEPQQHNENTSHTTAPETSKTADTTTESTSISPQDACKHAVEGNSAPLDHPRVQGHCSPTTGAPEQTTITPEHYKPVTYDTPGKKHFMPPCQDIKAKRIDHASS